MNRNRSIALAAVAVLALLAGGWIVAHGYVGQDQAGQLTIAGKPDAVELQALAASACLCTRAKGDGAKSACWKEFRAAVPGPSTGGYATMCAPVSTETECFSTKTDEICVVTGYDANGVSDPGLDTRLCTVAEVQAVEYAEQQAWRGADGKDPDPDDKADWDASNKRANAAINRVVRRIMNGETIAAAGPASAGCAG